MREEKWAWCSCEENKAWVTQVPRNTGWAVKLPFIIRNSFTLLYVFSQPLFSSLQYTFNALASTNKLNQSCLNIIDCGKLQHWESIDIKHIYIWPEILRKNSTSVDGCVFNNAALKTRTDLNIQKPASSRSIVHPVQEHIQGQRFLPYIFLALFTTQFIDLI